MPQQSAFNNSINNNNSPSQDSIPEPKPKPRKEFRHILPPLASTSTTRTTDPNLSSRYTFPDIHNRRIIAGAFGCRGRGLGYKNEVQRVSPRRESRLGRMMET